jgi:soluble lytic murein transglycosylase-like protein
MIQFVTNNKLPEDKALKYASLIFHASQKYGVNPPEIIALIMAESQFKETSINAKSGDYGLGQINWKHWGKDYGLSRQDLLDPAINIYMTCHVYKYFGKDFGKYHRGFGIKSKSYVVNVKSILSSLHVFAEMNPDEVS